jgi:hypothetical protein
MQSLSASLPRINEDDASTTAKSSSCRRPNSSRRWRHKARFVLNPREHYRPVDRNRKAKIMHLAESMERESKTKGLRSGWLGLSGIAVLRALLFHCLGKDGRCDPSYARLKAITGLARATIAKALRQLEDLGILQIIRRLDRRRVSRRSPITGEFELITTTVQTSSLYAFSIPQQRHIFAPWPAKLSSVSSRINHTWGFQREQVERSVLAHPRASRPETDWRGPIKQLLALSLTKATRRGGPL